MKSFVQHPSALVRMVVSCGMMTFTVASSADAGS